MLRHKIKKDILNGKIFQQLMLLFFPVFIGYLLQQFYGFVDAIILGKVVGKTALASVGGSATVIINIVLNIIAGFTAAVTVLLAQNYGKGNSNKATSIIKTGYFVSIVLGAILTILILLLSPTLLKMMNQPAESMQASFIYLRFYAISFIPYFIYQTGISILRAIGENNRSNNFILILAVTKILFDYLLAGIIKLGVFGTSLATFLSYLTCAVVVLLIFNNTPEIYHYSLKDFGCDKEDLKSIIKMGTPFAIQNATYALPSVVLQSKINGFGTDAVAAYAAYAHVDSFYWCYANALATVTMTMIGQNFGNNNMKRVKKTMWTALLIDAIGSIVFGVIFLLFGTYILQMFTNDARVVEIGMSMLKVSSSLYLLHIFVGTFGSVFKGCGLIRFPVITTIFTILITRISYLLVYPHHSAKDPIYCFPISWLVTSIIFTIYLFVNKKIKLFDKKA